MALAILWGADESKKRNLLNGKIKNVVGFGEKKCNIINLYDIM